MMFRRILISLSVALGIVLVQPSYAAQVRVRQGTIGIPTYLLGPPDPNPPFPLVNSHNIYPYTALDDLTAARKTLNYQAIYLENEYLKATILPGLDGRVYSLYDKVAKREVFYRNNVIKYGLVGLRGAWISGGIEFNFPNGHTTDTVSPVDRCIRQNPDGSATVTVGDVDQVSNMYWQVALTLRPGVARLEQRVTLLNSTSLPELYWWWANASVPATPDMQFIYPMREANPHSHTEIWTFPDWKGVDYSWYKNVRHATSLFGVDVHRDFFGAYYHKADDGVIHVADYHQVYGKKTWTWGVAGDGLIWTRLLTDNDGPYNEIQAGRFQTQLSQEVMPPHRVETWTEYWYPVQGLGSGFVEGTPQFAINAVWPSISASEKSAVDLAVSPAVALDGAKIEVKLGNQTLKEFAPVSFEPLETKRFTIPVADIAAARKQLDVTIQDAGGSILLHWFAGAPIDGNQNLPLKPGVHAINQEPDRELTIEELFLRGVDAEGEGTPLEAARIYNEVLARDSGYVPALMKLAARQYLAADFPSAEALIVRALARDPKDPRVQYLAGVIYRGAGELHTAKDAFWSALRFGGEKAPAFLQLGEISIQQKDYSSAMTLLQKAITYNPGDGVAQSDLAVALRRAGNVHAAAHVSAEAVQMMPTLPYALAERWRDEERLDPRSAQTEQAADQWRRAVGFRSQSYLEAGAWYRRLGDLASSDFVLRDALRHLASKNLSPLIYYYLAANTWDSGMAGGTAYAARVIEANPEAVFPDRVSEAAVLREALAHNPLDSRAQYYLGNFLFAHDHYQEAAQQWGHAVSEGYQYPVLFRNLGIYAWKVENRLPSAAQYYAKAIAQNPQDYRLYVDLDEIYTQLGETAARARLLAAAPLSVQDKDTVRARKVLLDVEMKQYDKALEALHGHDFKPWEGGQIIRDLFVLANVEKGRQAYVARHFSVAEKAFREAMTYPDNLGIGPPDNPQNEEALYWLGNTLKAEGKTEAAQAAWEKAAAEGKPSLAEGGTRRSSEEFYTALALGQLGHAGEETYVLNSLANRATQAQPGPYDYYLAGLVADHGHRNGQAAADFSRALSLDPSLWQARIEIERSATDSIP